MAYNSQNTLAKLGKQLAAQIRSRRDPSVKSPLCLRRVHVSAYDKNPEEHDHLVVTEHVIRRFEAEQDEDHYWAPHPRTGVFGPAANSVTEDNNCNVVNSNAAATATIAESVLEQKTFFRSLEDMEKPIRP